MLGCVPSSLFHGFFCFVLSGSKVYSHDVIADYCLVLSHSINKLCFLGALIQGHQATSYIFFLQYPVGIAFRLSSEFIICIPK